MDTEPSDNSRRNSVQDSDRPKKKPRPKRPRSRPSAADTLPAQSDNEILHVEPRSKLPNMNERDETHVAALQIHGNEQVNGTESVLRPPEIRHEGPSHLSGHEVPVHLSGHEVAVHVPAPGFDHYSYMHANSIISSQSAYMSRRPPLHYSQLQNPDMPHEAAYNLYNSVTGYGPSRDGQHQQLQPGPAANSEPIRQPENAAITMPAANVNGDEIIGGGMNYIAKDTFPNELDRFGSPLSNMSFDFGVLDNPPSPPFLLDDFMGLGDDEMMQYFGA